MLYGRDAERARIGALLDAARASRSGALVITGAPGIGKTALLEDAHEQAGDMHVLVARGLESESDLPFAGLHQLLRPALHLLHELPVPQASALEGALALAQRPRENRFLISAACLTLLSELAEERPVLCLVDDAHWLDTPSSDALVFAARRLGAEGIAMLFAARDGEARRFEAHDLPELVLGGLDGAAAAAFLATRVEGLHDAVRDLLVEHARGNALALVELPLALTTEQLAGRELPPETLPLTENLEELFLERVRRLPERTQRLLVIVAANESGRLDPIMRAAEALGIHPDVLGAAERAGLVRVGTTTVEWRHPLVRSAVYQAAEWSERCAAHGALADALTNEDDIDRRAWHRAAACPGPDAEIADQLATAAERARLRSGHAAAAAALERAAELTPDVRLRGARLVAAANAARHAGQPERASALLDRAAPLVRDASVRAEMAYVRGEIAFQSGSLLEAAATLMAGAEDVGTRDPHRALAMLRDAANACENAGDDARFAEAVARAAAMPRNGDEPTRLLTDLLVGVGSLVGSLLDGSTAREVPLVRDAIARADLSDDPIWVLWAAFGAGVVGDEAREAELLRRAVRLARDAGAVDLLTRALLVIAAEGLVSGRFAAAVEAAEGLRLARDASLKNTGSACEAILAWFAAAKGRDEECRRHVAAATEHAQATGMALARSVAAWALSLLDLANGRPRDAVTHVAGVREGPVGVRHPYVELLSTPDFVEACTRIGDDERARRAFGALEGFAQPGAPTWALALAARCRAVLSHGEAAEREFVEALRLGAETNRPFDRARTALLYGEYLRRKRRRTDAREQLRSALDGFEQLGAITWAERARTELRASGETARKRDPSTIDQLTPQELQIARFVADGLSNKEIAAQLFLSPRTIDYHLRNIFTKLGITSRTQLARLTLGDEARVAPPHAAVAG